MLDKNIPWRSAPERARVERAEVDVWRIWLDAPDNDPRDLSMLLSSAERLRAGRFYFERDRGRFIAGRGVIRKILSQYLDIPPGEIELTANLHGKPMLAGESARGGLQFNLAHSEGLALLAVTRRRDVGIDVEQASPTSGDEALAATFCSPRELAQWRATPAAEREGAFFRLWTSKEAWLKATGRGLSWPLEEVEVSPPGEDPARFIRLPAEAGPAQNWSLHLFEPAPGFAGALVTAGEAPPPSFWRWNTAEKPSSVYV